MGVRVVGGGEGVEGDFEDVEAVEDVGELLVGAARLEQLREERGELGKFDLAGAIGVDFAEETLVVSIAISSLYLLRGLPLSAGVLPISN